MRSAPCRTRSSPNTTGVDVLVNNAGVALAGNFEQVSETDFEWLFGINFWGVVRMTRAFLPLLKTATRRASLTFQAFRNNRPAGQYGLFGKKIAVRGFSESLRMSCGKPASV